MSQASMHQQQSRERSAIVLYGDTPAVLRYLMILMAITFALIEGLLLFRVWSQLMASIPHGAPLSWLYGLSGEIAAPFRPLEGQPIRPGAPALEFSAFVAIEGFLVTGLACIGLLYSAARLAQIYAPNPWIFDLQALGGAWARLDASFERGLREITAASRQLLDASATHRPSRPLPIITAWSHNALRVSRHGHR